MHIEKKMRLAIAATKLAVKKSRGKSKWVKMGAAADLDRLNQLQAELKILGTIVGGPISDLLAAGGWIRLAGLKVLVAGHPAGREGGVVAVYRSYQPKKALVVYPQNETGIRRLVAYLLQHVSVGCDGVAIHARINDQLAGA